MGVFLVVSRCENILEHAEISKKYDVGFEINDFFYPDVLDDFDIQSDILQKYKSVGIPEGSTMHGAFFDVSLYSLDADIMRVSYKRMIQSMDIASELGVKGVVFHTNYNPRLTSREYDDCFVKSAVMVLEGILKEYTDIDIYLENMFDESPHILKEIAKALKEYNNFGICLDWAHACLYGEDIRIWVEELKGYVKHIHLNDNDMKKDMHWTIGIGKIDFNAFKECYERYFKECSVLIETNKPKDQIESLDYLKKLLNA